MNDLRKTKAQLAAEVAQLRNRMAELETAGAALQPIEMSLSHSRNLLLALSRAAQAVQRARTPDEIYRAVGEQIKALGFEATVCILDQTAGNLILKYTTYAPAIIRAGEKLAGISLQAYRMPISPTSVYGRVLRTGQAEFTRSAHELVVEALPTALRPLAGPLVRLLRTDQGIVAPLRVDEESLGLLLMAASGVSPDDVPAMNSFAAQVAISLRNVRLAQQAQAELAERKQAEAALRESEVRYRTIFDNAPVGFFQSTPQGRYLTVNPAMARMFGYASPDEMLASITDIASQVHVDPARRQDFMRVMSERGEVLEFVNQNRRKDGSRIHTLTNARAVRDEAGGILYYEGFITDITARHTTETALRDSEARYRSLVEGAPGIVYSFSNQRGGIYYSSHVEATLGYTPDDLYARPLLWYESIHPDDRPLIDDSLRQVEHGLAFHIEYRVRDAHGNWHWFDDRSFYNQRSGAEIIIDGLAMDITDRKQAEDALRASESLYHSLVEVSPLSICRKDLTGRFTFANRRFLEASNITLADLAGKTDFDLHPPDLAEKYQRDDRAVIASGQIMELIEERTLVGGEPIVVQTIKAPIYDGAGNINGVQIAFWDVTARQQAEAALRESEQRLHEIIDNAPFGAHLYELRPEQQLVFIGSNRAADLILGVSHQPFIGKTIEEAFPPLAGTDIEDAYRRAAATGERYDADQVDYAEGGIRGAFEVHAFQTGPDRMATFFRDVTERKRAEEQRQRYEFIVNTATEFMTLINREHMLEAANDAYCRAQGRSRAELVGRSLAEVWGEARYREKILPYLEQCFAGRSVHYEDTFAFDDDEPRFYQVGMYPYTAASGGPVTYAAVVTVDVTDRVRAEAALRDLNAVLGQRLTEQLALLNATAAISSSLDIDTILHQVAEHMGAALNVTSTYICGWEPATGRSTVLAEWLGPEAVAEQQGSVGESYDLIADFGDDLDQWLLSGQPFISQIDDPQLYEPARQHMLKWGGRSALTVPLVIKGRSIGYVDLWESRYKREFRSDDIVLAQAIAQQAAVAMENARLYDQVSRHAEDLEERVRQRTRQLSEANARLSELDRLKDDFISRISHELRTPLTSIKIYLELLETGKPERHAKYMQVLNEQTTRLQQLIESLLEVTQKSANIAGLHAVPTDLNRLAATLVADAAPRALQHGLTLTSQLAADLPLVSADAILLAQALSNLVSNALSYTPAGGAIDLSTAQVIDEGETWITFAVRDTGPGIAPHELAHLFDRFYRGRAAADYKTPGAGVGLSISRDILTALDGRLTAQSEGVAGHGSTFTAWLRPA